MVPNTAEPQDDGPGHDGPSAFLRTCVWLAYFGPIMMEFDEMWAMFTPPQIMPVPGGVERPLWSVMIPTFNRTTYLRRTLESVLAQDPGSEQMQIEVVDDCSTVDDPGPVVRAIAGGRVGVSRNSQNLGLMRNLNRCIE